MSDGPQRELTHQDRLAAINAANRDRARCAAERDAERAEAALVGGGVDAALAAAQRCCDDELLKAIARAEKAERESDEFREASRLKAGWLLEARSTAARLREVLTAIAHADVVQSDGTMLRKIARAAIAPAADAKTEGT